VVRASTERIAAAAPRSIDEVRAQSGNLIGMSDETRAQHIELKQFLRDNLYRHYRVQRMTLKARRVVQALYQAFFDDVNLMPDEHHAAALALQEAEGTAGRARAVADYVAGMTDRYAIREHERMFVPSERS
jgi:dGTPase